MNVVPVWRSGITGKNVVVAILDDGLERDHPDLIKNYVSLCDYYATFFVGESHC